MDIINHRKANNMALQTSTLLTIPFEIRRQIWKAAQPHDSELKSILCTELLKPSYHICRLPYKYQDPNRTAVNTGIILLAVCKQTQLETQHFARRVALGFCSDRCLKDYLSAATVEDLEKVVKIQVWIWSYPAAGELVLTDEKVQRDSETEFCRKRVLQRFSEVRLTGWEDEHEENMFSELMIRLDFQVEGVKEG